MSEHTVRTLYCTSKFGLEGLNKAMALDLSKFGIRTVTVFEENNW